MVLLDVASKLPVTFNSFPLRMMIKVKALEIEGIKERSLKKQAVMSNLSNSRIRQIRHTKKVRSVCISMKIRHVG